MNFAERLWPGWINIVHLSPLDPVSQLVSIYGQYDELCQTTLAWLDQHCSLVALQWSGRDFCQMDHFQLFSMILKFSTGHFLSFYTDFYGPFSKLIGLWRMAPCLPNHWPLDLVSQCLYTASMDELCRTTLAWLDQHCSLVALRPGKYKQLV